MNRKILSSLLFVIVAGLFLVPRIAAQFTTASLSGTVADQSGAYIPDAKVTVLNLDTGFTQTVSTGGAGDYLFSRLPVGRYKLTVEKEGLQTYIQSGIQLTVNQAATQNVQLQVAKVVGQVTVLADIPLVTTSEATLGQLVDEKRILDLPLNGRQVQQLVFLTPGSFDVTEKYCGLGCEGGIYPGQQYASINGGGPNSVNYQLDGGNNLDTNVNQNLPFPNPDAVQEFNVQTNNMSAEYGNAVSGVVNVVTKSGTNQIHADVFEFLRNGALNARNFFAPTQDSLKRNQFGGSIGGPIKKDKLFYFGTYQGTRLRSAPQGQIAFVPTQAERSGDFADLLPQQLKDPLSGTPFPSNQIPVSQFNSVSQFFLKYVPLPNGPGHQLTYLGPAVRQNDDQFMIKVDYNAGKHQITGRYFYTRFSQPPFVQKANLVAADVNGNLVPSQNLTVADTFNVSPHLMLNSWFGWDLINGDSLSSAPFGFPDAGVKIAAPKPPEIALGVNGYFNVQTNHLGQFHRGNWIIRETAVMMSGSHELHVGVEALRIKQPLANTFQQSGQFSFFDNLSGDNLVDFILGEASQFTQAGGLYMNLVGTKWSAYAQDNWRVNQRLSVNAGLRWDPFLSYTDSKGRMPCFVPGAKSTRYPNAPVGLLFAGPNHDRGCPPGMANSDLWEFAPRVGFAYKLTQDGKTSIRGGAGFYLMPVQNMVYQNSNGIAPFSPIVTLNVVNLADPYGSAGVPNPFPAAYGPSIPGSDATFQLPVQIGGVLARNFRLPQAATWNLTIERQVATNWLVRLAYVGNKGTYLYGTGGDQKNLQQINPAIYAPGSSTIANTQDRRIYKDFGVIGVISPVNNSNYHAAQLTVEKRFGHGVSILSNYTWSKTMDNFSPLGAYYSQTNPFNRHFDYGPSDDDLAHVFKLSGIWQLPVINRSGLTGKIVNGWELTSIITWRGGFPFSVFSGYDNSFSGYNEDRADFTGTNIHAAQLSSGRSHADQINQWFNTALFTPNAIGTFGNSGKNILRGPKAFNTDLGLLKNTGITEKTSLQFRAEFFNAFNNVNFFFSDRTVSDGAFGQITAARDPRILQFGLKLLF